MLAATNELDCELGIPWASPMEAHVGHFSRLVIISLRTNVKLHGTSPWHPENCQGPPCSANRDSPRDKPVASLRASEATCESEASSKTDHRLARLRPIPTIVRIKFNQPFAEESN